MVELDIDNLFGSPGHKIYRPGGSGDSERKCPIKLTR